MIHPEEHMIGPANDVIESEKGICFKVQEPNGAIVPAFAVKFDGRYFAYINRCGHIAVRLDYLPGQFFSDDGQTLICSTHGAEYAPDTGACLGGPCYGVGLDPLNVTEHEGRLYLDQEGYKLVTELSTESSS